MSDQIKSLEEGFKNDLLFGMSAYQLDGDGFHVLPIEETLKLIDMEQLGGSYTISPLQNFKTGDYVIWDGKIGVVKDDNYQPTYPVLVVFQDGSQDTFTKQGRMYEGRSVELFRLDRVDNLNLVQDRLTELEQRVQRQAELLEQMERALDELTDILRPSPDLQDPIQQLHKQIIDQYPVEPGQVYQAIDSDGAACRYAREPYLGVAVGVWNYEGATWYIDDVELNGINWRDTLIKL